MTPKKKMGRPFSDNPLSVDLKVRVTEETAKKLDAYCAVNNIERAKLIRKLIEDFLK